MKTRWIPLLLTIATALGLTGCNLDPSKAVTTPPGVNVQVTPSSANVIVEATQQFSATVTGTTNLAVTWEVNGIAGGSSTLGKINSSGLYTAPAVLPTPASLTITAVSAADAKAVASSAVTVAPKAGIFIVVTPGYIKVLGGRSEE